MQIGNPIKINLVNMCKKHNPKIIEKGLHDKFSNNRLHGEWFKLNEKELSFVIDLFNETEN